MEGISTEIKQLEKRARGLEEKAVESKLKNETNEILKKNVFHPTMGEERKLFDIRKPREVAQKLFTEKMKERP